MALYIKNIMKQVFLIKTEIYSYTTEGIGEDIIPKNVDFTLIDHFEKVTDKDAALMTRELAKEGILAGNSCGSALTGLMQMKKNIQKSNVIVVILPDHGSRYMGKIYNDNWMKNRNFI